MTFPDRYIQLQEEYIKDEQRLAAIMRKLWSEKTYLILTASFRSLKRELVRAQEEIKRIQSVPLVIGQFMEAIDQKYVPCYFFLKKKLVLISLFL